MRAATTLILAVLGIAECQRPQGENLGAAAGPVASVSAPAAPTVEAYQPPRPPPAALATARCVSVTPAEAPRAVPPGPDPRCAADPEPPGATPLPGSDVGSSDVRGVEVRAEVVRSEQETSRGLMYRKNLAEERGMLFDLRVRGEH